MTSTAFCVWTSLLAGFSPLSVKAFTWRKWSCRRSTESLSISVLSFLVQLGRSSARLVHYSSAKCGMNKLESGFLWTHHKLRARNRGEKKAKYIEQAEKLLGHTNVFFRYLWILQNNWGSPFENLGLVFTLTHTCRRKMNLFPSNPDSGFLFYIQVLQQGRVGSDLWFAHFYWSWSFRIIHS